MDWIAASAEWRHFKHAVRAEWKNLTSAQLDVICGVRARLGEQICSATGERPVVALAATGRTRYRY